MHIAHSDFFSYTFIDMYTRIDYFFLVDRQIADFDYRLGYPTLKRYVSAETAHAKPVTKAHTAHISVYERTELNIYADMSI